MTIAVPDSVIAGFKLTLISVADLGGEYELRYRVHFPEHVVARDMSFRLLSKAVENMPESGIEQLVRVHFIEQICQCVIMATGPRKVDFERCQD